MKKSFSLLIMLIFACLLHGQKHAHWGSTGDPLNGLVLTWQSMETSHQIKWGYTTSYEQGTFSAERRDNYSGHLFDYKFPTLSPSSTIHYSILYGNAWTQDKVFETSVHPSSAAFSFIAGGDSRTNMNDWQNAANKLSTENVDFHFFMGDHVNSGTNTSDWTNWFDRGNNFLSKNLIYHTGGNHEFGSIYLNQFVMPGNEKWYSFEFGNALFICLLSEEDFFEQHDWLVNELANTTKKWKVVFFHKPFFTTGSHANDMNSYRNTWWKAFDDYGVDVILNGHTHYYLRTKPINLNVSTASAVDEYGSDPGQGRLQVIAGSYGAPVSSTGNAWFIEENKSVIHYTKFEINDNVLDMNAYDMSGTLIDNVSISKELTALLNMDMFRPNDQPFIQNFPNPFKSHTTINYYLKNSDIVSVKIFNLTGQQIISLVDGFQNQGVHQINWYPIGLASGTYICRLELRNPFSGNGHKLIFTKKLIYQK